jgi:catechol 2,3-dioxygenase-like lactoylglutathione lyase family enzyme
MSLSDFPVGAVMAVSDLQRARDFYEGKLGLTPQGDDSEEIVSYECGDGTGFSIYLSPDHAGKSTATMAAWVVADVEKEVDDLASKGVTPEQYDQPEIATNEKGIAEDGDNKVAWVRDPDGNTFAINQA